MPIEDRDDVYPITHALVRGTPSRLQGVEATQIALRKDFVKPDHICGYEIVGGAMKTEYVTIQTPPAETTGERIKGLNNVAVANVLRAAMPLTGGLPRAFLRTKQGVISADRDERMGMDDDGDFPATISRVKLPEITKKNTVTVADPMLVTGSAMCSVLNHVPKNAGVGPERLFILSAVSTSDGLLHVDNEFPEVDLLTVAVDDYLDDDGYIVPGLDDAGDRTFRTT